MGDLAQSAVTIERAWTEGGPNGKDLSCRQVTLVVSGQGDLVNKINASVLCLSKIEQSTTFVQSTNFEILISSPSYDGTMLLLSRPAVTSTMESGSAPEGDPIPVIPMSASGTYRGVVKGYL